MKGGLEHELLQRGYLVLWGRSSGRSKYITSKADSIIASFKNNVSIVMAADQVPVDYRISTWSPGLSVAYG